MSSPVQSDEDEVEEVEFVSVSDVYTVILFFVCFFKSMGSKDHFKKPIVQHFDLAWQSDWISISLRSQLYLRKATLWYNRLFYVLLDCRWWFQHRSLHLLHGHSQSHSSFVIKGGVFYNAKWHGALYLLQEGPLRPVLDCIDLRSDSEDEGCSSSAVTVSGWIEQFYYLARVF